MREKPHPNLNAAGAEAAQEIVEAIVTAIQGIR
jgi:hypothetical protein